jgi:xylulokinase
MLYLDKRSEAVCARLRREIPEETVLRINGNPIGPQITGTRMAWIREHEPNIYTATAAFLPAGGYLGYRLTGRLAMSVSEGGLAGVFDIAALDWSDEMLAAYGLDRHKLPEILPCGQMLGRVTAESGAATGLVAGTPVIVGGFDGAVTSLGVGAIEPGQVAASLGTSFAPLNLSARPTPLPGLMIVPAGLDGHWLLAGVVDAAGGALRWFRDEFGELERNEAAKTGESPYTIMDREVETTPPGADGLLFLPYMAGARNPVSMPTARGALWGLTLRHQRAHLLRAVLEGAALGMRHNLVAMTDAGVPVTEIIASGGAARSDVWLQIIADIAEVPVVRTDVSEGTCLAVAILAGVAVGVYADVAEATKKIQGEGQPDYRFNPRPEFAPVYRELYEEYLALSPLTEKKARVK